MGSGKLLSRSSVHLFTNLILFLSMLGGKELIGERKVRSCVYGESFSFRKGHGNGGEKSEIRVGESEG